VLLYQEPNLDDAQVVELRSFNRQSVAIMRMTVEREPPISSAIV